MEEIIQKAINGGYEGLTQKDLDTHNYTEDTGYALVCDHLLWKALGKSCGWDKKAPKGYIAWKDTLDNFGHKQFYWQYIALRFHEINLTEGWTAAMTYLQTLCKTK